MKRYPVNSWLRKLTFGLPLVGLLLWCGTARAQIMLQDGSLTSLTDLDDTGATSISESFTVTAGASVLVVSLYDQNNTGADSGIANLSWGTQALTKGGGQYISRTPTSCEDMWYLFNPTPGTHTITATDTSGNTPTAMAMQAYTLNGVNAAYAPAYYSVNGNYVDGGTPAYSVNVILSSATAAGAWAVLDCEQGSDATTMSVTSTSGTPSYGQADNTSVPGYNGNDAVMGGIAGLAAGSSTITGIDATGGESLEVGALVFTPGASTAAPINVVATGGLNQVALSWQDDSGGTATNYIVLRSTTSGSGYTAIATNTANASTNFTDTSVVNYLTYYYVVEAVGPIGISPYSAQVSAFAAGGLEPAPTGLTATPLNTEVGLIWNVQNGATGYNVLRATGSPTGFITVASPAAAAYTDTGLVNGTTYYYEVNAVNSYGTGPNSGYVGAVPVVQNDGTNTVIPPMFFGLHAMGYGSSPYPVPYQPWGLIRDWDHWGYGNVNWQNLEPSRGTFTWTAMDATVNAVTNLNVKYLHCFGAGPSWAGGNAPTNIADWDLFITNFVTRYHTKIKYLETWNEAASGEGFYTGTTAMLVQMEHDLYTITKSIDPTVTVLTPDATGGATVVLNFFDGYFAAGGTNCDGVAFHAYNSLTGVSGANNICYPEEMFGIVANLKSAMKAYGQGSKPIFATEGDWGTEGTNANQPTTNDAVAFMARQYMELWSLGVSSYAWYDWENNNGYWQFGEMWDPNNGGLNAAGVAYQQLYNWMVGARMSQLVSSNGSVYTCGFTRPGGYQALAVWNTTRGSPSTFTVPNGYVQYRDLAGNLTSISGSTVTIGIEPILLENMTYVPDFFSGLTSPSITYGTTNVVLTGIVSSNSTYAPFNSTYPPSGTVITVTINGNVQTTTSDATGDFSINYNTAGLTYNVYPVTYSCAAAGSFPGGTDTTTTLTVNPPPLTPAILPASLDSTGTNLVVRVVTVNGHTYYLLSTTSLNPPVVWTTNSVTAGTGGTITNLAPITSAAPQQYFMYLAQ